MHADDLARFSALMFMYYTDVSTDDRSIDPLTRKSSVLFGETSICLGRSSIAAISWHVATPLPIRSQVAIITRYDKCQLIVVAI